MNLNDFDPELAAAMAAEAQRQQDHLELIASENYTSALVMQAQGSVLTNKYAEGYPGKRYYGGCEHVDVAETLAIDRAERLFGGTDNHLMLASLIAKRLTGKDADAALGRANRRVCHGTERL